jgi:hypothetical protein
MNLSALADYVEMVYTGMEFVVATRHGETEPISCTAGVMKGMNSSLMLFGVYLDALLRWVDESVNNTAPYVLYRTQDDSNAQKVSTLGFADDMKLISTTAAGMQGNLNRAQRKQ